MLEELLVVEASPEDFTCEWMEKDEEYATAAAEETSKHMEAQRKKLRAIVVGATRRDVHGCRGAAGGGGGGGGRTAKTGKDGACDMKEY